MKVWEGLCAMFLMLCIFCVIGYGAICLLGWLITFIARTWRAA